MYGPSEVREDAKGSFPTTTRVFSFSHSPVYARRNTFFGSIEKKGREGAGEMEGGKREKTIEEWRGGRREDEGGGEKRGRYQNQMLVDV